MYAKTYSNEKFNGKTMDSRRSFAETIHNGRPEENGNSQLTDSEELRKEADMIQRRLAETEILDRLKEFMVRKLNSTDWKDKMFSECKDYFTKENTEISFDQLYATLKKKGKSELNADLKKHLINQMQNSYRSSLPN